MKISVTFKTLPDERKALINELGKEIDIYFLEDYPEKEKERILLNADIILTWNPEQEGIMQFMSKADNLKFVQLMSAGFDHINPKDFPDNTRIASNQGAYAEPMAEHVMAFMLALSKRLTVYHKQIANGVFEQLRSQTKFLKNSVLGIIGFGSIGKATAKLARPFGVKIMGINTSGKTDEAVDFIGTLKDIDYVLQNADTLVLSCALNEQTEGIINRQKLELMKPDAVLINVARGPIIVEKDLYEHLKSHPDFYAGIDAWWIEPFKYGKFEIHYPFFELPNIIGSPHNSALVKTNMIIGIEKAAANIKRFINNEPIKGRVN
jgi:phosphoglycerate dehydrogenase-like enzyme